MDHLVRGRRRIIPRLDYATLRILCLRGRPQLQFGGVLLVIGFKIPDDPSGLADAEDQDTCRQRVQRPRMADLFFLQDPADLLDYVMGGPADRFINHENAVHAAGPGPLPSCVSSSRSTAFITRSL